MSHVLRLGCVTALQRSNLLTACGFQLLVMSRPESDRPDFTTDTERSPYPGPGMILRNCSNDERRRRWRRGTRGDPTNSSCVVWEDQREVRLSGGKHKPLSFSRGLWVSRHHPRTQTRLHWQPILDHNIPYIGHDQRLSQNALWHAQILSQAYYRVKEKEN